MTVIEDAAKLGFVTECRAEAIAWLVRHMEATQATCPYGCGAEIRDVNHDNKSVVWACSSYRWCAEVNQSAACKMAVLTKERDDARTAIETLRKYAEETEVFWDADHVSKVGKRLAAMSGRLPEYSAEITAALAEGEKRCTPKPKIV